MRDGAGGVSALSAADLSGATETISAGGQLCPDDATRQMVLERVRTEGTEDFC